MKTKTKKVRRLEKKVQNKQKHRKSCFHRKNRKLQRFFSILEKNRQQSQSMMVGGGLFGLSKEEKAKSENAKQEKKLQTKDNFGQTTTTTTDIPTDQQQLLAHKDLKSAFEKSEEAKLTKELKYQRNFNNINSVVKTTANTGLAFAVANATVGLLAATGVGLPAAGGIAVCLIIISKIMTKIKELQELRIVMLDTNIILTNCYYLENMINKVLTIFQIYINDITSEKKYFRKIITVDEYTNLNNSCKNIKQLVDENKPTPTTTTTTPTTPTTTTTTTTNAKPKYSDFIEKTKNLKGYNLGERIKNAKELYIHNNNNINDVIQAENEEYTTFGKALEDNNNNYINIDDDDALESLMKYTVYTRIQKGLSSCDDNSGTDNSDGTKNFYDKKSKLIYQMGVDPDIKFRIKQKLNIIRDLLIEIDPTSAQDTMNSVELNESLDKVEEDAFTKLNNSVIINNYIPIKKSVLGKNTQYKDFNAFIQQYVDVNKNEINEIKTETNLNTHIQGYVNANENEMNRLINKILNYWLRIKQYYGKNPSEENEIQKLNDFLTLYKTEWTQFLKKCFLKIEYYKQKKNKNSTEDAMKYTNYENWVRDYLKTNTKQKKTWVSTIFRTKDGAINGINLATAKTKTSMLMNTMNLLNALFIIINSQFETVIREYGRALATDTYTDNNNNNNKNINGIDRIWELCQSTVAYQKFILPPDFSEDKKAILDQVEVSDLTETIPENNNNTNT
jgi:hypothetical protein